MKEKLLENKEKLNGLEAELRKTKNELTQKNDALVESTMIAERQQAEVRADYERMLHEAAVAHATQQVDEEERMNGRLNVKELFIHFRSNMREG